MSSPSPGSGTAAAENQPRLRPAVDVIVPFAGSGEQLEAVRARMARLVLRPGDSFAIIDNTPGSSSTGPDIVHAAGRRTPAFARNRGAEQGSGEWLVFLDADVVPSADLLDRYFDPPPAPQTGLIGGGLLDEPVGPRAPLAARYTHLRRTMSQERTFAFGEWGYPKSANVACRRKAFEQVHGFNEQIRAAEDADLAYRLRNAGWEIERRDDAAVVHLSRRTLRGMIKQQALWGAGGAWLHRTYPGSLPLAGGTGLVRWAALSTLGGIREAIRRRDRDALIYATIRPLEALAWELGRLLPNERRATR